MTECKHEAFAFFCRIRQVGGSFSGGSISPNGGALLLCEVDQRLGLTAAVARFFGDRRQRGKVRHRVLTMLRQRVHAVALGYEDLNDHTGGPRVGARWSSGRPRLAGGLRTQTSPQRFGCYTADPVP